MNEPNASTSRPRFTKGEKCILGHLVLTITVLIILVTIYLLHIGFVSHKQSAGLFDTRRSVLLENPLNKFPIGIIYANITPIRNICNTLLLTPEWSVSAGHCVAMLSESDLAYLSYAWMIKYSYDIEGMKIKRNIVHPNFNRDTFANNIGLVEHMSVLGIQRYEIPKINTENDYYKNSKDKNMAIISWDHGSFNSKGLADKIKLHQVQYMTTENCSYYVSPITELRAYEFCIVLKKKLHTILGHGALAIEKQKLTVYGTFTWGETQQNFLPLVVLNLSHYKEWTESVTSYIPFH